MKCMCESFERLEGASVNGYIAAFLKPNADERNQFVCSVCQTIWEKRAAGGDSEDKTRTALVKRAAIK